MPQRQNQVTHKSDEVQGEGSYVVMRRLTFGERLKADQINGVDDFSTLAAFVIPTAITAWNWVDDKGNPLLLPADGLEIRALTDEEVIYLVHKAMQPREKPEPGKN